MAPNHFTRSPTWTSLLCIHLLFVTLVASWTTEVEPASGVVMRFQPVGGSHQDVEVVLEKLERLLYYRSFDMLYRWQGTADQPLEPEKRIVLGIPNYELTIQRYNPAAGASNVITRFESMAILFGIYLWAQQSFRDHGWLPPTRISGTWQTARGGTVTFVGSLGSPPQPGGGNGNLRELSDEPGNATNAAVISSRAVTLNTSETANNKTFAIDPLFEKMSLSPQDNSSSLTFNNNNNAVPTDPWTFKHPFPADRFWAKFLHFDSYMPLVDAKGSAIFCLSTLALSFALSRNPNIFARAPQYDQRPYYACRPPPDILHPSRMQPYSPDGVEIEIKQVDQAQLPAGVQPQQFVRYIDAHLITTAAYVFLLDFQGAGKRFVPMTDTEILTRMNLQQGGARNVTYVKGKMGARTYAQVEGNATAVA